MTITGNRQCGIQYDNWCIVTGKDFRARFRLRDATQAKIDNPDYDPEQPESAQNPLKVFPPKDLTGYTGQMDIRETAQKSSELIKSLTVANGGIILGLNGDPTDGWVQLFIDNTETNAAPINESIGKSFYDLFLFPPGAGDDNDRLFFGTIQIKESTTDV